MAEPMPKGYVERTYKGSNGDLFNFMMCSRCGAAILDAPSHDDFHATIAFLVSGAPPKRED